MNPAPMTVYLLDGGMGQELVRRSEREPTALWSARIMLDQPALVRALHVDFIRAGARTITLNAYAVTPQRLARTAEESRFDELQAAACRLAHEARDSAGIEAVRIAGCLPPLAGSYRPDVEPDFHNALQAYRRITAVQAEHVDIMLCETVASVIQAKAAAMAGLESGKPVWVAFSVSDDSSVTLRSGEPLTSGIEALDGLGVEAVLLNCSTPEAISAAWPVLADCRVPVGAYANGFTSVDRLQPGGTVRDMPVRQDLDPDRYADFAMTWAAGGASILGGCCEVGPAHIARMAERLDQEGYQVI